MKICINIWGNREKRNIKIIRNSLLISLTLVSCDTAFAYTPGTIAIKAQPIIGMVRELSDPTAYISGVWACIRLMLNQKAEAKEMLKNVGYGYTFVQLSPLGMELIRSIGN